MNRIIKLFVVIFAVALSFTSTSCDEFSSFPINIPFSITVVTQGSNNPAISNAQYCLTESETYEDYVDDIEGLTFVQAAFRTDSVKNITNGTIKITLSVIGGSTIFQKTLSNINPADYKSPNGPFVLALTDTEIQALNTYFNQYLENPNQCLQATVEATVNTGTPPYYLKGIIDMVVEAETKI
ncbi:MAG: hypothetical protein HXY50_16445 [Ignavibacteriaceae bacterium]|nr:hypothetical protein [Ignavibacteriaceae bacterium]